MLEILSRLVLVFSFFTIATMFRPRSINLSSLNYWPRFISLCHFLNSQCTHLTLQAPPALPVSEVCAVCLMEIVGDSLKSEGSCYHLACFRKVATLCVFLQFACHSREKERVCVCVCVCQRERERERESRISQLELFIWQSTYCSKLMVIRARVATLWMWAHWLRPTQRLILPLVQYWQSSTHLWNKDKYFNDQLMQTLS